MKSIIRTSLCALLMVVVISSGIIPSISALADGTTSNTSYQLTVDLFNNLIDDETVIDSFYGDINHAYPNDTPDDLTKVADFGKQLTANISDNYDKAKAIFNWFEQNFTYDYSLLDEKNVMHDQLVSQGMSDSDAWAKVSDTYDIGSTGNMSDQFYKSFVNRTGICLDYARLFDIMAVGAGIPTENVRGDNHFWNIFWYDGHWVIVDTTMHEFDKDIESFTSETGSHYVTTDGNDASPEYYNSSAEYYPIVAMHKGDRIQTTTVITADQFMQAAQTSQNIIVSKNICLNLGNPLEIKSSIITINPGVTLSIAMGSMVLYEDVTTMVQGTLGFGSGAIVINRGSINVADTGSIKFDTGAIFNYYRGTISGASNIPPLHNADIGYAWTGSEFVDVNDPSYDPCASAALAYKPMTPKYAAGTVVNATLTTSNIDGTELPSINVDGSNYTGIRNLADYLNGTYKQFNVTWDAASNEIQLIQGQQYVPTGTETTSLGSGTVKAIATSQKFIFNGHEVTLVAFNVNGTNFIRIRDLAILLNFDITWNSASNSISLDLWQPYSE